VTSAANAPQQQRQPQKQSSAAKQPNVTSGAQRQQQPQKLPSAANAPRQPQLSQQNVWLSPN
jgi:hypothetical protein